MNLAERRLRKCGREGGFTLIEVVIAIALVALALFGLVSVITHTTRSNMSTKERTLAMRAAERKIEQMMAYASTATTFSQVMTRYDHTTPVVGYEVDNIEGLSPQTGQLYTIFVEFPRAGSAGSNSLNETIAGQVGYSGSTDPGWMELGTIPTGYPNAGTAWTAVDLNADGITSNSVGVSSCTIIPCRVRVKWKGVYGNSELVYKYTFLKKS